MEDVTPRAADLLLASHAPAETERLGWRLAVGLRPGMIVLLRGEIGTGKTVLTRGIARGLGVVRRVTSPTYTFIAEYPEADPPLFHMDLYRLLNAGESVVDLGFDDYLERGGVVVVEWPAAAAARLPADRLEIILEHVGEAERQLAFWSFGDFAETALQHLSPAAESP
ncbi:MAG TPA: tRNA (adenosine(37)-N6)-threonylcarbamoyltransferase complex ATPase subunit type 1 TsaE [Chloroflexota bacterium]|nr:tRNA (adenosine(37)-N6)-threonylcarbamoyltransferase complex ATPase subunit type 1 TsaE [Chloroflexota bacterium]